MQANGQSSAVASIPLVATAPQVWQEINPASANYGYAVAINQDGTINSPQHPAQPGWIETIFVNGAGMLSPQPSDGSRGAKGTEPVAPITVQIGMMSYAMGDLLYQSPYTCPLKYVGAAPGLAAGVVQVNFQLPSKGLLPGSVLLSLQSGSQTAFASLWTPPAN